MTDSIQYSKVTYNYNGPLQLTKHDYSELVQSLKPSEIIVKIKAAALNPVDLTLYNSHQLLYFGKYPKAIGRDFSGIVEHKGADVTKFEIGDKIAGLFDVTYGDQGTLSEFIKIDTNVTKNLTKFNSLSYVDAASFPLVFGTAFTTLIHHKKPDSKSKVLVYGGGSAVGSYIIQLLKKYYKAELVVSVNSSRSNEKVLKFGADEVIDYTKEQVLKDTLSLVEKNGKFDLVIDTIGTRVFFPKIDDILKPKSEDSGYITIVGDYIADYNKSLLNYLNLGTLRKRLFPNSFNYTFSTIYKNWIDLGVELLESKVIEPYIDSVYDLKEFDKAVAKLRDHKAQGKVVVTNEL